MLFWLSLVIPCSQAREGVGDSFLNAVMGKFKLPPPQQHSFIGK